MKVTPLDFEAFKSQFVFDVKCIIELEEIPPDLVINWDHTGIHYVPVSSWTMAKEGSKRVEIAGIEDKRQITAVFAGTMSGKFLPPQIIYAGKTARCLPSVDFPEHWDFTYTPNHWANELTTERYIQKILIPYIEQKKNDLALYSNQPALVIFDRFKGQCTENILEILEKNNIHVLIAVVPPNCTDRLQPLDVSVNKSVKEQLRQQFQLWYSDKICNKIKDDSSSNVAVDLCMSVVKPLSVKWLVAVNEHLLKNPDIIVNGFKQAGLYV